MKPSTEEQAQNRIIVKGLLKKVLAIKKETGCVYRELSFYCEYNDNFLRQVVADSIISRRAIIGLQQIIEYYDGGFITNELLLKLESKDWLFDRFKFVIKHSNITIKDFCSENNLRFDLLNASRTTGAFSAYQLAVMIETVENYVIHLKQVLICLRERENNV